MSNNISQVQLRSLIEQLVDQAIGQKLGQRGASWQSDQRRIETGHTYDNRKNDTYGGDLVAVGNKVGDLGQIFTSLPNQNPSLMAFGNVLNLASMGIQTVGGLQKAYKNGDPISGALTGMQGLTGIGAMFTSNPDKLATLGWVGLGIGLLAGFLGGGNKTKTEWNRPKFKDAEKAYNKLFTVDRGEEDLYYMPESFYFRNGWSGPRHIVVQVGNEQFNDHIRDSMTDSYATQLQRGLVF